MASLTRRNFLKTASTLVGALGLSGLTQGCRSAKHETGKIRTGFKYAMCNESMQTLPWTQQCEIIGNAGYSGIEIAPFTLVKEGVQEINATERQRMLKTMQNNGLACAGLHWLLAPPPKGLHFTTPDAVIRRKTIAYLNALIDFCGDLEGTAMIFGSPKQRNTQGITIAEAKKYFAAGMATVADHARQRGVKILIEPLDTSQTDVINTLAEAKVIIDQVQHPAIQTMFDFHNTPNETEPFHVLIDTYASHIHHVHVQEMDGQYLSQGNGITAYKEAFQTLKDMQFDKWISLEVFDFKPGGKTIAEESMRVLKEIEASLS
jgi:sugar phosphate isomerase/epimerase